MNGRVYDPVLGMFLSPDPYVQAPDQWTNYNRYAYCMNNPLRYTDPSGYWWGWDDLLVGVAGFAFDYVSHGLKTGNWGKDAFAAGAMGAVSAWIGYNTGGVGKDVVKGMGTALSYAGNLAISTAASYMSMTFPIGSNFSFTLSPTFGIGSSGFFGGMNASFAGKIGDFGFGAGIGSNSTDAWSWGASVGIDGCGLSYSRSKFTQDAQTVGGIGVFGKRWSFTHQNDLFGDGGDRFRTGAFQLQINNFTAGFRIYTNDPIAEQSGVDMDGTDLLGNKNDKYFVNGKQKYGAWEKGRVYEAPIYVGWNAGGRHVTMGYSSRWVQDRIQNALHRSGVPFTNLGHQSFYNDYSQMYEGWFSNSGSINNLSLW